MSTKDKENVSKFISRSKVNDFSGEVYKIIANKVNDSNIFDSLIDKSSSLDKVLRVVTLVRRACNKFLTFRKNTLDLADNQCQAGREKIPCVKINSSLGLRNLQVISSSELSDAWNQVISLEQNKYPNLEREKKHLVMSKVDKKLSDGNRVTLLILGSRVKMFPIGFNGRKNVPYLPAGKFARLIVERYHKLYHCDIDTLV